jgi:hypothetical protein
MPPLLAACDALDERHTMRIVEDKLRRFEVDSMLGTVRLIFGGVPFDPPPYLRSVNTKYRQIAAREVWSSMAVESYASRPVSLPPAAILL